MNAFVMHWNRMPLYVRILIALLTGSTIGYFLNINGKPDWVVYLELPSKTILRMLSMLAPPLVLVAVIQALVKTEIPAGVARRLGGLLLLNTVVAILIGLFVANVLRPGAGANLEKPAAKATLASKETDPDKKLILETMESAGYKAPEPKKDVLAAFIDNVPKSIGAPLNENNVIGVIILALMFGVALRKHKDTAIKSVVDVIDVGFETLVSVLMGVLQWVPLGVGGVVATIVADKGLAPLLSLGWFIVAVIAALILQAVWYLTRIQFGSWASPKLVIAGCRDALVMAFSTASSTATMPVTYQCLRDKVGLRERSASLGALVGSNFNNDGTALYEAVAALFVAQLLGINLTLTAQVVVVLTSIVASVGAAGIPEAGLVTMALVFNAVGLDTGFIALIFSVDWFLDRCRTAINVMGDINVACILDGRKRQDKTEEQPA
jgi:Na+/H+-dicarboxylate symporter